MRRRGGKSSVMSKNLKEMIENLNFRLAHSDSCHAEDIMRDFDKELKERIRKIKERSIK